MKDDLLRVLFSKEQIEERVCELGAQIASDFAGKSPLFICMLKGGFIFFADIVRAIGLPCEIRFLTVSSYGKASVSSGTVSVAGGHNADIDITGRDVILFEDIVDSGVTIMEIRKLLLLKNPLSLSVCTLLDKPSRRQTPVKPEYAGFTCPDEFVVGYGLDYAERYRNLPYVAALKPEIYSAE